MCPPGQALAARTGRGTNIATTRAAGAAHLVCLKLSGLRSGLQGRASRGRRDGLFVGVFGSGSGSGTPSSAQDVQVPNQRQLPEAPAPPTLSQAPRAPAASCTPAGSPKPAPSAPKLLQSRKPARAGETLRAGLRRHLRLKFRTTT
jgi:hypothetical protein